MAKHTDIVRASRYEQKSHRRETTGAICEYRRTAAVWSGMLAWRNTQTLSGQAGMSKKATGEKRLGRFANTGGDCGSAKHGAIDFHVWWCLGQQTRGFKLLTLLEKVIIIKRKEKAPTPKVDASEWS